MRVLASLAHRWYAELGLEGAWRAAGAAQAHRPTNFRSWASGRHPKVSVVWFSLSSALGEGGRG
eukprot:4649645-Amphidinium_carterae.2